MQSADFWSVSKPKEKGPGDTGHLKINVSKTSGSPCPLLQPPGGLGAPFLPLPSFHPPPPSTQEQGPGIQLLSQFSFSGPSTPSRIPECQSSHRAWKSLSSSFQRQGPKAQKGAGTCLKSHSKSGAGTKGQCLLLPAGGIPHFPISCRGWGRPQGPRGRAEVWAGRVPACLFH